MKCKLEGEVTIDVEQCARLMSPIHVGGPTDAGHTDAIAESDVLRIAARAVQLYAERHPRPIQVNMRQAAEMLGLSHPTVRKLMHCGKLRFNKCGLIPIEQVDKLLAAAE